MSMLTGGYFPTVTRLPEVKPSDGDFGTVDTKFFGVPIPIRGVIGDQQASAFGNCCFGIGDVKITLGTSAAMDINVGPKPYSPTIAGVYPLLGWQIGKETTYFLESMLDSMGTTVSWLIKNGFAKDYKDLNEVALAPKPAHIEDVYFVPALNGLSSPPCNPRARGMFIGITTQTTTAHMVQAVVESFGFNLRQLREAISDDTGVTAGWVKASGTMKPVPIRVDGGAARNNSILQSIADAFDSEVHQPAELEGTCLGAAFLAGLAVGVWKSRGELKSLVPIATKFERKGLKEKIEKKFRKFTMAADRAKDWIDDGDE
jgi:putative glycerol kinase 5